VALGDRVDHTTVLGMVSRQCIEHLAAAGTDPSFFVRQRIRSLLVDQDKRSVKLAFTSSAAATANASHAQPQPCVRACVRACMPTTVCACLGGCVCARALSCVVHALSLCACS
jgi:hypothetical protein